MFTKTFHPGMPSEYNDSEVQEILIFYPFMILPHSEMAKVMCLCNEAQDCNVMWEWKYEFCWFLLVKRVYPRDSSH